VVLTGAQKPADRPDSDGPSNLRQAVSVAASRDARSCGALIVFAGRIFPAHRTRKVHTLAPEPFSTSDGGPVGRVDTDDVRFTSRPFRPPRIARPDHRFDTTRVDVVAVYPGADDTFPRAAVNAGARGVVLAGTGSGNGNHALVNWVSEVADAGIVVGLSTRVPQGPVIPIYGNGGAVDLLSAGAVNLWDTPLYQARVLFALLIANEIRIDSQAIARHMSSGSER